MIDAINKLLSTPAFERNRRRVIVGSATLLLLHMLALILSLVFPDSARVERLRDFSYSLYGVTGGLLLLAVVGAAVRALADSESLGRVDTYRFIHQAIVEWFTRNDRNASAAKAFVDSVVSQSHTNFKVQGPSASLFDRVVHFEFTFYPAKLLYGIHFESASRVANEVMVEDIRNELRLDDRSGFCCDYQVPKRPDWIFLVRAVDISGDFEKDSPHIMTHARHFVELVGHCHDLVYSDARRERFAALVDRVESSRS